MSADEKLVARHGIAQALRPDISPVALDVIKTLRAAIFAVHYLPACRYVSERGPQTMLVFLVDQYKKGSVVVVEWIGTQRCSLRWGMWKRPAGDVRCADILAPSTRSESSPRQLRLGNPGPCVSPDRVGKNNLGLTSVTARP